VKRYPFIFAIPSVFMQRNLITVVSRDYWHKPHFISQAFQLQRPDNDYSAVEIATRKGLGHSMSFSDPLQRAQAS
jgi:hypothetical protein